MNTNQVKKPVELFLLSIISGVMLNVVFLVLDLSGAYDCPPCLYLISFAMIWIPILMIRPQV